MKQPKENHRSFIVVSNTFMTWNVIRHKSFECGAHVCLYHLIGLITEISQISLKSNGNWVYRAQFPIIFSDQSIYIYTVSFGWNDVLVFIIPAGDDGEIADDNDDAGSDQDFAGYDNKNNQLHFWKILFIFYIFQII